jgi:formylglycine-generating enzyme required for sulfatase activity
MKATSIALAVVILGLTPSYLIAQDHSESSPDSVKKDSITLEGWAYETFSLPPGFAPSLPQGSESLRFAPGWRDPESENFWSYAFVMWIDEATPDTARIDELLESYYSGLMSAFGVGSRHPAPEDHVQAEVTNVGLNQFEATMNLIDGFATFKTIELKVSIETAAISDQRSTVRIQISHQPKEHKVWRSLDTAIDSILSQALLLDSLKDREEYILLDQSSVESIALAAKHRWQHQLDEFEYLRVERFSAGGNSHWISIWLHESTQLEFALVPGGKFQMGSPDTESGRKNDEQQHWVTLDPFLIARTECTQKAWAKIANVKSTTESGQKSFQYEGSGQLPVNGFSPADVDTWCIAAGLMLPTEAQWEYMCRAGTSTPWTMGARKTEVSQFANVGSADCPQSWIDMNLTEPWHDGYGVEPAQVMTFKHNAYGLFDVHGNLSEWVRDNYDSYSVPTNPKTGHRLGSSNDRIARGGNGGGTANHARSATRLNVGTGVSPGGNKGFGFRPSVDLPF